MATPTLNVQIIPAPAEVPTWVKVVQLPARDGQGGEAECANCSGTGTLPRHGDSCRRCGGTGRARFVEALRADIENDEQRCAISCILESLPQDSRVQVSIRISEVGGGLSNTGHATIIAGMNGEQLPSIAGRPRCGDAHAIFYVHAALVVRYRQWRGSGSGTVSRVGVDRTLNFNLGIEETVLWKFSDENDEVEVTEEGRKSSLQFPEAAVAAARAKARDYHCRSAYYAVGQYSSGGSGPRTGVGAVLGTSRVGIGY